MKYLYSLLLFIIFLSFSCQRTNPVQEVSENTDSLKINSNRIVNTISETLIPKAKKVISEWKEYRDVDEFIIKYYNISNMEALNYAKELSDLVQLMKDSIRIEELKELNMMARFNVLHNETLRLADMATIPAISSEEVKEEVGKIVEVYSSLNSKINTIYKAEELQNSLEVDTETPSNVIEVSEFPEREKLYERESPLSKKPERVERKRPNKPVTSLKNRSERKLVPQKKTKE
ncbi:hypothetical protein [Lutibacter sp.]|uniref:hypothetical protein n=1 Tax=Lutibacter sp. TaxID=1925666 RepID=UPI003563A401